MDIATDFRADRPLFGGNGARIDSLHYDEDGSLALARALGGPAGAASPAADAAARGFSANDLDGSWFLQLTPAGPHTHLQIRGPMRIEVRPPKLRISGDIYVRKPLADGAAIEILRPITERPLLFGENWYPQLAMADYSWYFRSIGVSFDAGSLVLKFERHLWNRTTQEFIGQENSGKDNGFMRFDCSAPGMLAHPALPQPTLQIKGSAQVGGETYDAVITKTSPHYRGCAVEVDVMSRRAFPVSAATAAGSAVSFASTFLTAGMDCQVNVDHSDVAEDDELTSIELQTALSTNRRPVAVPDAWRLWLFVGSAQGDLYGIMFDDADPYREGSCGFYDSPLPGDAYVAASARGKKIGEVPDAFLRTLVHEAGHAFNLYHPKDDVHYVPIGTTIMNQTGDVMNEANETDTYPGNVSFAFDEHNRTSLIHSPDPQVAPGWKRFGWGHGSLGSGVAEPVDALGFLQRRASSSTFQLDLDLPEVVFLGQFVSAGFSVTNTGSRPAAITSALNLSRGDLRLLIKPPNEELRDVRDVIVGCGDRAMTMLAPGESLRGVAQIFYTNVGFTFRQTGRHRISAELDVGDGSGAIVRSKARTVIVRAPARPDEEEIARLSISTGVGRAFAFGDYGLDEDARHNLERLADLHAASDNGVAANLTLANSHSRNLRNLKTGKTERTADKAKAAAHFDRGAAEKAHDPLALVRAAVAIAAPTESRVPVIDLARDWLDAHDGRPAPTPAPAPAPAPAPPPATGRQAREKRPDGDRPAAGNGADHSHRVDGAAATAADARGLLRDHARAVGRQGG